MTTTTPGIPGTIVNAATKGSQPMTADVLWRLPRVGAPVPSPDGAYVLAPVTTYPQDEDDAVCRLWRVDPGSGEARPLTADGENSSQPAFSPDGRRLAFVRKPAAVKEKKKKDDGLPEAPQVYLLPLDGGEPERVTDMPLGAFDPTWLPDGSGIVFGAWLLKDHWTPKATREEAERRERPQTAHVTEERFFRFWDQWLTDGKVPHLFVLDVASREVRDLMPESSLWFDWMDPIGSYDIAPDGSALLFSGLALTGKDDRLESNVYRVPLAGGTPQCLTEGNPAGSWGARFTPDGSSVVFGMTEDPDFYADRTRLMRMDPDGENVRPVLTGWDRSPQRWRFASNGDLWFSADDDAVTRLFRLAADAQDDTGAPESLTSAGAAGAAEPAADGSVVFVHHSASAPPEVWRWTAAAGPERVTRFTDEGMRDVALGEVRDLRFEGADGDPVQMLLVLPPDYEEGRRYPLVHIVHGGPYGLFADQWMWRWHAQTFAAPGYVIAMVNFHGSTSWGQDFTKCIEGGWGDRPYTDVMRATDTLVAAGLVDEERMAVAGASYGGYLVSWIASQTNRFQCIVNHAGVYDLKLMYASDYTWGLHRAQGSKPWEDLAPVDRYDPARHFEALETPMLVSHGEKDYRVPANNALLCYGILKAKGVPARLVYFTDENHWVLKRKHSLLWYGEVLGWLKRWLVSS